MKSFNIFDDDAFFHSKSKIKKWIIKSNKYQKEDPSSAKLFLFFSTKKQRTYLVATNKVLYCITDDARRSEPQINWAMPSNKVLDKNGLMFSIKFKKDKSDKTGVVDIGENHKKWLFSKKLFSSSDIESSMRKFIESSM